MIASTQNHQESTLLKQAQRGQINIDWRKTDREHVDEHVRLEDIFLDDVSASVDDDYQFDEGKYHFDEVVKGLDVLEDGEVIDRSADETPGLQP